MSLTPVYAGGTTRKKINKHQAGLFQSICGVVMGREAAGAVLRLTDTSHHSRRCSGPSFYFSCASIVPRATVYGVFRGGRHFWFLIYIGYARFVVLSQMSHIKIFYLCVILSIYLLLAQNH